VQIEHVVAHHRFLVRLAEGDAVLAYRLAADGTMDIRSTWVPAPARGRGIGGALVEAALVWARSEGRPVIPSCWYVGVWVAEHPEYRDVLVPGSA
jgi:uncharacterized protein